jgi:L-lactate dehydrogenase (cytochrome)
VAYEPVHPSDALEKNLPREKHIGTLDAQSVKQNQDAYSLRKKTKDELRMEEAVKNKPPLREILCLQDLEDVARSVISYKTSAYYSSSADDQICMFLESPTKTCNLQ